MKDQRKKGHLAHVRRDGTLVCTMQESLAEAYRTSRMFNPGDALIDLLPVDAKQTYDFNTQQWSDLPHGWDFIEASIGEIVLRALTANGTLKLSDIAAVLTDNEKVTIGGTVITAKDKAK